MGVAVLITVPYNGVVDDLLASNEEIARYAKSSLEDNVSVGDFWCSISGRIT